MARADQRHQRRDLLAGASTTSSSWTWSSTWAVMPLPRSARSARSKSIIAFFMISAAPPWMGMLTAIRSAAIRICRLAARMSGMWRRRPVKVSTHPHSRACFRVCSSQRVTAGKLSKY